MATPAEILSDPNFHALPLGDRLSVLRSVDPNFAALHPKDQGSVISAAQQRLTGIDKIGNASQDKGFLSTIGEDLAAIPGALYNAVSSPKKTLESLAAAQHEQFEKGRKEFGKGNYIEAAGHTLAGALPVLGPAAATAGEEFGEGKYGQGAAHALELLGTEAAKALPAKIRIPTRNVKNVNTPQVERALASVEPNVRMTPGQRAGQRGLQSAEQDLLNKPATANVAEDFYQGQQDDLAAEGRRRIASQPGTGAGTPIPKTDAYGAGSAVKSALADRVSQLKSYADKLYDSTRQTTARNLKEVQVGTKTVPGPNPLATLTPEGMPRTVPVMAKLETPVDLNPVRQRLAPVYEELKRSLPDARRANSPAWKSLEDLMTSGQPQMNAMDFDRTLSAVKSISRNGSSNMLSTQAQRLAKQVIAAGEQSFQDAVRSAGPNAMDKLNRARKAVAEYHDTADFLADLNEEPAALYQNLTTGGDRVQNTLNYLSQKAPQAVQTVGKTYLEGLMDKATREGGFGRSAGVMADWDKIGPQTKKLIFGPQLTQKMDDFLLAAKRLTPHPGSPTAGRISAIMSHGDVGMALAEFIGGAALGHPVAGATAAGLTLMKTRVQPSILANLSFQPAGATLLKRAVTLPVNSSAFASTMQKLNAMALDQQQDNDDPLGLFGGNQ